MRIRKTYYIIRVDDINSIGVKRHGKPIGPISKRLFDSEEDALYYLDKNASQHTEETRYYSVEKIYHYEEE